MIHGITTARHFVCVHRLCIGSIAVIVLAWGGVGFVLWNHFEKKVATNEASYLEDLQKIEMLAGRLEAKKQSEIKAETEQKEKEQREKDLAEAKAQQVEKEAGKMPDSNKGGSGGSAGCNSASTHLNPASIDVLVNKKHCLQPLAFVPPDLVTTYGATISAKAANDFNRMYTDAASAGQPFSVTSSYRSYTTQVSTYDYWVSVNGRQGADTVSARPGYSEHQTGLAIDVSTDGCTLDCFGSTSQYQWFQANAANYGFIQRYYRGYEHISGYASEEWHYRYVGVPTAQDMKAKGIKTLEQYWGIEGGDYN